LCGGGGARGGSGGVRFEGPLVLGGDESPLHRYIFLFIDSLGLRERRD
jgi:hypothetical protein